MSRHDARHLEDILAAIGAIRRHLRSGALDSEVVFDAARMRLIEIGEAAKGLPEELTDRESAIPWRQIAGMRDRLAHRYYENEVGIIQATVDNDIPELAPAVERLAKLLDR